MEKGNANNHDCNMVKCKQVGSWHTAKKTQHRLANEDGCQTTRLKKTRASKPRRCRCCVRRMQITQGRRLHFCNRIWLERLP